MILNLFLPCSCRFYEYESHLNTTPRRNKFVGSSLSSWLMAAFGNSSVAMKFHYCFSPWPFFITILMHQECMYDLLLLPGCPKLSWCCTWIFRWCNQNCSLVLSKNTWDYIIRALSAKSQLILEQPATRYIGLTMKELVGFESGIANPRVRARSNLYYRCKPLLAALHCFFVNQKSEIRSLVSYSIIKRIWK